MCFSISHHDVESLLIEQVLNSFAQHIFHKLSQRLLKETNLFHSRSFQAETELVTWYLLLLLLPWCSYSLWEVHVSWDYSSSSSLRSAAYYADMGWSCFYQTKLCCYHVQQAETFSWQLPQDETGFPFQWLWDLVTEDEVAAPQQTLFSKLIQMRVVGLISY